MSRHCRAECCRCGLLAGDEEMKGPWNGVRSTRTSTGPSVCFFFLRGAQEWFRRVPSLEVEFDPTAVEPAKSTTCRVRVSALAAPHERDRRDLSAPTPTDHRRAPTRRVHGLFSGFSLPPHGKVRKCSPGEPGPSLSFPPPPLGRRGRSERPAAQKRTWVSRIRKHLRELGREIH